MPYPITITPRRPGSDEEDYLTLAFPNLNLNHVWIIGEPTNAYNCIGWTVGRTTNAFLWPGATLDKFTQFYKHYGAAPMSDGDIALYALKASSSNLTHGAVYLNISAGGIGETWTSKLGKKWLISHSESGLDGGPVYGSLYQKFGPHPAAVRPESEEGVTTMALLTSGEQEALEKRVAAMNPQLAERFAVLYAAWKATWSEPSVSMSSDPAARARSNAFRQLIALGPEIVPLLMNRLRDVDDFFALQAVERLVATELVFRPEIENPAFLTGEQGRAAQTLKNWIAAVDGTPIPRVPRGVGALKNAPYMSQANAVGQGFNVYGQLDLSSLMNPLFDSGRAPTQTFTFLGNDYLIPTYITAVQDTRGYSSGGVYDSRSSLQNSIAAHAQVEIGYGVFSGEMSADYAGEFDRNTRYTYVYNNFYAPLAYLQLNTDETYLSAAFRDQVNALPAAFTTENFLDFVAFFRKFGGYYTKKVTLGGSFSFYVSVENSSELSDQSIDLAFNAQVKGLVNSGGIDTSVQASQTWKSYSQASKTHVFVSGGDPSKIADLVEIQNDPLNPSPKTVARYSQWAQSIAANPAIVDFALGGIWELCGSKGQAVQQAWTVYSQRHCPRLTISTQSQVENWSGGPQPLPQPIVPVITLGGTLIKPEEPAQSPAGYQLVVLENNGEDITEPSAVLFNQYYSVPAQEGWSSVYDQMYQQLDADLRPFAGSGAIVILVSFGMDWDMPPTHDAFALLSTMGAGSMLSFWENNSDPGSMKGSPGAWVSYPANYILVSTFDSGPDSGVEVLGRAVGNENSISNQVELFLFKQEGGHPYTIGK
jgi:hypothetical protein